MEQGINHKWQERRRSGKGEREGFCVATFAVFFYLENFCAFSGLLLVPVFRYFCLFFKILVTPKSFVIFFLFFFSFLFLVCSLFSLGAYGEYTVLVGEREKRDVFCFFFCSAVAIKMIAGTQEEGNFDGGKRKKRCVSGGRGGSARG